MQRKTESDYNDIGRRRGAVWIGDVLPATVLAKTTWRCSRGHIFEMRYSNLASGRTCPVCSRRWRRRADDYRRIGEAHGLQLVGRSVPRNTRAPALWKLVDGRTISLSYRSLSVRTRRVDELSTEELDRLVMPALDIEDPASEA